MAIEVNKVVDARGLACPMPIVRTKRAMVDMEPGHVLEVQATDQGSLADMQSWAKAAGHHYIGFRQDGNVWHHFVRKAESAEEREVASYPHTVTSEELRKKREADPRLCIVDVREPAEYAFARIPGALCLPLGRLEAEVGQLNPNAEIYVICRTGSRSDLAASKLAAIGFSHVYNVVPGMTGWAGPIADGSEEGRA